MKTSQFTLIIIGLAASMPFPLPASAHDGHDSMVVIRDDCEPNDPGYAPTAAACGRKATCRLPNLEPSCFAVGADLSHRHQAWRMDPP